MRNFFKSLIRLTLAFLVFIALLIGVLHITGNGYLVKGVRATYLRGETSATIDDKQFFPQRHIAAASPSTLPKHRLYNEFTLSEEIQHLLDETQTSAFVIVKSDSLLYESYPMSDPEFTSNSFSMAKTVITLLTQIAVQEGKLMWNDKVKTYIPELTGTYADALELWHLSTMTAGLDWEEQYKNPFSIMAKAYYGKELNQLVLAQPIREKPGQKFQYSSGVTQLLSMALENAVGMPVSNYAAEKLWTPLGMEKDASWHLDEQDGAELAYCCLNATARDFARLGMLIKNKGKYGENQIVDAAFIEKACTPFIAEQYGWAFWILQNSGLEVAYFRGVWGQFIIPIPEKDAVLVRLGKRHLAKSDGMHPDDVHQMVEFALENL